MAIKVLEIFSGIRATSEALNRAGIEHITTTIEINPGAQSVANQLWGTNEPLRDATKFETNEKYNLVVAGFPCQPFSSAGKGLGFEDPRGKLFKDTLRIIKLTDPEYVILENVKTITSAQNKWIIDEIETELKSMGYFVTTQIIDAKNYLPQKRERLFIIASKKRKPEIKVRNIRTKKLIDFLENGLEGWDYFNYNQYIKNKIVKGNDKYFYANNDGIDRQGNRVFKSTSDVINTLGTSLGSYKIAENWNEENKNNVLIRQITPREAWRLMGWYDNQIDKIIDLPKSKLYFTAGNSMVIPVMEDIVKELIR